MSNDSQLPIVLIVDDAPEALDLLKVTLESNYRVRLAISGDAALKVARQVRPDIILLDILMPGLDGYEVCSLLKAEEEFRHVPVIFVTALDEVHDEQKGFSVGAVDYITKPISPPLVKARIATHLAVARQARELDAARIRAEEESRARAAFFSTMSHEIRTPLSGILGMVRLMMETDLDSAQSEYLQTIHYSGEALMAIINDILDFSKINAGKLTLETIPFDLCQTIEGVVSLLGSRAHEKGLRLVMHLARGVPNNVAGDSHRLRQILLNLVGNAIKFTLNGEVAVTVTKISRESEPTQLRFAVKDSGIGIDESVLPNLFNDFIQSDESISRRFGGSGLGLAICKRLVELMGGTIGVTSKFGEGSTFWFELPLEACTASPHSPQPEATSSAQTPLNILLAEDNPVNQKVAFALLTRRGHRVTAVTDGLSAVNAVTENRYDVVLMDMNMPLLGGIEATRRIRRLDSAHSRVPIVAFTASPFEDEQQRCIAAGMNAIVTKPVNPAALVEALVRVVRAN